MRTRAYKAAGGVVVYQNQVLVLNRPDRKEIRLPKGHIEKGESSQEAALREVMEESGYPNLIILEDLGSQRVEFDYQGEHVARTEYYFLMTLSIDPLQVKAIPEKQFVPVWLPWKTALEAVSYEAEREWLRRAKNLWGKRRQQMGEGGSVIK